MWVFLINAIAGYKGYSWRVPIVLAIVETIAVLALVHAKLLSYSSAGIPHRVDWPQAAMSAFAVSLAVGFVAWWLGRRIANWRHSGSATAR